MSLFPSRRLFSRQISTRADFYKRVERTLFDIQNAGTFKSERVIKSPQDSNITVGNGGEVINFCANNYLGLCNDPSIKEAAKQAIDSYGAGLGSVRFICGTQVLLTYLHHNQQLSFCRIFTKHLRRRFPIFIGQRILSCTAVVLMQMLASSKLSLAKAT